MAHHQSAFATQRQFSPQQASSPSPTNGSVPGYGLPTKRPQKMSPNPPQSQPSSPYTVTTNTTGYAHSTPTTTSGAVTPTSLPSPVPASNAATNSHIPQHAYAPLQQPNGRSHLNGGSPVSTTPVPPPQIPLSRAPPMQQTHTQNQNHAPLQAHNPPPNSTMPPPYSNATLTPINQINAPAPAMTPGNMGPPAPYSNASFSVPNDVMRQTQRPAPSTKVSSYDVNDMLMGTGIDLDEEFDIQNNVDMESRTGFPHHPPGGRDSFYGSGMANTPAEHISAQSQEEFEADNADYVWNESAKNLQAMRMQELRNHALEPGLVHKRLLDTAVKYGLGLNLEPKDTKGRFPMPADFPAPEIRTSYQKCDDGFLVETTGSFIPQDSMLSEQIALISLGTQSHIRNLLSDANQIALTRQQTSHGAIPTDWKDAAALPPPDVNGNNETESRTGAESAVSPRTNPLKRSADAINTEGPNYVIGAILGVGKDSQSVEESRLKKRLKRAEKASEKSKDGEGEGARSGSVAPGTPGLTAPDGGDTKAPSKKEGKKAAAKAAEGSSSTQVNSTLSLFSGGRKKKYSWMTANTGGSGSSTPRASSNSGGPAGSGAVGGGKAGQGPLTKAGVQHVGQFREDSEKGKKIQLRDWIVSLEAISLDHKSLQHAYDRLDKSDLGDKVSIDKP